MDKQINLNSNNVIHQLRKNGYKVKVHHQRYSKLDGVLKPRHEFVYKSEFDPIHPRGGKTEVYITTPDGKEIKGVAECSKKDPFNRKIALKICLGRAFKQLSF